ncbi:MAG: hypothetical protein SGI74_07730 [Oligoflexia bacterium]|nr:hypothetical protein [Oligoflexia bacterium]
MEKVQDSEVDARVSQLEALVEELLKENPIEERIEKKMKELDISYTSDPVERINRVLAALHPHQALDFEGE